jgi:hypothetical protein
MVQWVYDPPFPVKFCAGCDDHDGEALHRKCPRCGLVEIVPTRSDRDRFLVDLGKDQVMGLTYRGLRFLKACSCEPQLPTVDSLRAEDPVCISCGRSWPRASV